MKVLFLDIDGVINSEQSAVFWNREGKDNGGLSRRDPDFCPIACSNLLSIFEDCPDVKIVVSSTWRLGETIESLEELLFTKVGIPRGTVVGITPAFRGDRGLEIADWLKRHPEVTKFAIVDDDADMAHLMPHLKHTSWRHGLLRQDAIDLCNFFLHPWRFSSGMEINEAIEKNGWVLKTLPSFWFHKPVIFEFWGPGPVPESGLDEWAQTKRITGMNKEDRIFETYIKDQGDALRFLGGRRKRHQQGDG